jgi:hypothetical protein
LSGGLLLPEVGGHGRNPYEQNDDQECFFHKWIAISLLNRVYAGGSCGACQDGDLWT